MQLKRLYKSIVLIKIIILQFELKVVKLKLQRCITW